MYILAVVVVYGIIFFADLRPLIKAKNIKETIFLSLILFGGFIFSIIWAAGVKIPSLGESIEKFFIDTFGTVYPQK